MFTGEQYMYLPRGQTLTLFTVTSIFAMVYLQVQLRNYWKSKQDPPGSSMTTEDSIEGEFSTTRTT